MRRLRRISLHVPLALAALLLARPTPRSLLLGLLPILLGLGLRVWAAGFLHKGGGLCVWGPYRFVRHPLYLGTTFSALGLGIIARSPWAWAVILPIFVIVYAWQVNQEEELLATSYAEAHAAWRRQVPKFLPRLTPAPVEAPRSWQYERLLANRELRHVLVSLALVALFAAKLLLPGAVR
jgi:protein-S-isoprenylcysteine O-methyltransferase Ste14